nr:hypothetical protein [Brucella anthropi]
MAGYDFEFYETGTISVTAGQKAFTGTGTAWKLRGCEGALVVVAGAGAVNFVSSLSTDAAGEFRTAWAGPTLADASYVMWLPSAVAATALANHQRLAEIIAGIQGAQPESAILSAFATLQGSDGKLPMFTGENTLELVEYIADAKGSLKKLAALELAANKFLNTNAAGELVQSDITAAALVLLKLAGTAAADQMPYFTGANGADLTALTAFARTILDDATGAAMWATMGGTGSGSAIKFPNGVMLQRGTNALPSVGYGTIPFPTAFPTACYGVVASISENAGAAYTYTVTAGSVTRASFYGTGHTLQPGSLVLAPVSFQWIAWGN